MYYSVTIENGRKQEHKLLLQRIRSFSNYEDKNFFFQKLFSLFKKDLHKPTQKNLSSYLKLIKVDEKEVTLL